MSYTASGPNEIVKVNYDATTDPTTGNDETEGYSIGSRWVNTTTDKEYVAVSVATGSASWEPTTLSDGTTAQDAALFAERADHVNTPAAGLAEIWVENAAQQEVVFTDDLDVDYHLLRVNQVDETLYRICVMGTTGTGLVNNYATLNTNAGLDLVLGSAGAGVIVTEHTTTNGPPVTAGQGAFWTKTGTPNVPMFTDDTSAEHPLLSGETFRMTADITLSEDIWRTWNETEGWMQSTWTNSGGSSTGDGTTLNVDPVLARWDGGILFPEPAQLDKILFSFSPVGAHSTFDVSFDVWKAPLTDGETTDGTAVRLLRATYTVDGTTNKAYLKSETTFDTAILAADDHIQIYATTLDTNGHGIHLRFRTAITYRRT